MHKLPQLSDLRSSIAAASRPSVLCSFICDELDGRFARMFGQTTMLGQVLDMVTDR